MGTLNGDVSLMPLGDLILWIANKQMSCSLTARRGSTESRLVVRDGMVLQAASTDPREYLGQHLINFGYIDEDGLQKAFETQQETKVPLGRVLVMVDAVNEEQLRRVLIFKVRESVLELMAWPDGQFRVTDEVPDTDLDSEVPIHLLEAHSEGVARAQMWQEIRRVFPSDAVLVDVLVDPARVESSFDRRLLSLMAQGKSVGEAALELRSVDFQTYARLYDLSNRKLVKPRITKSTVPPGKLPRTGTPMALPRVGTPGAFPVLTPPPATFQLDDEIDLDVLIEEAPATSSLVPQPQTPPPALEETVGGAGLYMMVRPEQPKERPGVTVPFEATDPHAALRVALAGRNWNDALLLAQRILERDALDSEAIAAYRVADVQVRRSQSAPDTENLGRVPSLALPAEQVALAHLTSRERYVLSRIDGRRSLQQIAAVSPIQKTELIRIVDAFVNRGVVKLQ